jgi:hypothetical protein
MSWSDDIPRDFTVQGYLDVPDNTRQMQYHYAKEAKIKTKQKKIFKDTLGGA